MSFITKRSLPRRTFLRSVAGTMALRDLRDHDDPAEYDSPELAALLLPAVRGSHRPLTPRHFAQLRRRARRRSARTLASPVRMR